MQTSQSYLARAGASQIVKSWIKALPSMSKDMLLLYNRYFTTRAFKRKPMPFDDQVIPLIQAELLARKLAGTE